MAILGIQFVISFTIALFFQKLSPFYSLARWIMCGKLFRYLHPTNEELKRLSGKYTQKGKGRKEAQNNKKYAANDTSTLETFTIPCGIDIELQRAEIQEVDLYSQHKYSEYKWIVDYSLAACATYIVVELASVFKTDLFQQEFNLSLVWCALAVSFSLKELGSLTASYLRGDTSGERSMCISFVFFFLVVAMMILIVDGSILEFGLQEGYEEFCENLQKTFSTLGFVTRNPPPLWTFKFFLVILSALLGGVLGFPGIRWANIHLDSLLYYRDNPFIQVLFHCSFLMPLLVLLLWVKPLARDLFTVKTIYGPKNRKEGEFAFIPREYFNQIRFYLVLSHCLLRLLLTRKALQSYLNMAFERVAKLRKEAGRITNVDLQRKVARVFFYLSSAALQFMCPILLVLFLTLISRSLDPSHKSQRPFNSTIIKNSTFLPAATQESIALLRKVFTVPLFHAVVSYFLWWTLLASFSTSLFGVLYLKVLT